MPDNDIITYRLTERDYLEFNKYINFKQIKFFIIPYTLIYLFFVISELINFKQSSILAVRNHTFIFIAVFFIGFLVLNFILKRKSKKVFMQNKVIQMEKSITINNDFIEVISENSNSKLLWNDINKIIFTNRFIYLMLSNTNGIILPKIRLNSVIIDIIKAKKYKKKAVC